MNNYLETEVKVLNINVIDLQKKLEELGAKKVFDDNRIFTTFDTIDKKYLSNNKLIRLTEEGKLKLSISYNNSYNKKETIKVFTSREKETLDFLSKLDLNPIAKVKSHRISYELNGIDFDIDQFPLIPPFLEIDIDYKSNTLIGILEKLSLNNNEIVTIGTEDVFAKYDIDYFDVFKI